MRDLHLKIFQGFQNIYFYIWTSAYEFPDIFHIEILQFRAKFQTAIMSRII